MNKNIKIFLKSILTIIFSLTFSIKTYAASVGYINTDYHEIYSREGRYYFSAEAFAAATAINYAKNLGSSRKISGDLFDNSGRYRSCFSKSGYSRMRCFIKSYGAGYTVLSGGLVPVADSSYNNVAISIAQHIHNGGVAVISSGSSTHIVVVEASATKKKKKWTNIKFYVASSQSRSNSSYIKGSAITMLKKAVKRGNAVVTYVY